MLESSSASILSSLRARMLYGSGQTHRRPDGIWPSCLVHRSLPFPHGNLSSLHSSAEVEVILGRTKHSNQWTKFPVTKSGGPLHSMHVWRRKERHPEEVMMYFFQNMARG